MTRARITKGSARRMVEWEGRCEHECKDRIRERSEGCDGGMKAGGSWSSRKVRGRTRGSKEERARKSGW
jgi:hypothetical protein